MRKESRIFSGIWTKGFFKPKPRRVNILVDYLLYLSVVLDPWLYHTLHCEPLPVSRASLADGLSA